MVKAHCFDAMVCIPNCDKIVPGMLMGALRVQRPDDLRLGRAHEGRAKTRGRQRPIDLITVFEGVAAKPARRR